MRIDLHTHTRAHSSCSLLSPDHLCELALIRGLDGLAITEHHHQWRAKPLRKLEKKYPGLKLYSGVELSLQEGYDLVCLCDPGKNLNLPFPSLNQVLSVIRKYRQEVFLFVAHPFRYSDEITPELESILRVADGIEMLSVNTLRHNQERIDGRYQAHNQHIYEQARREFDLIPLYNSDAHFQESVGSVSNILDCPSLPENETELAALLRQTTPVEHQAPELLQAFF